MHTIRTLPRATDEPIELLEQGLGRLMWLEHKRLGQVLAEHNLTVPQFLVLINLARGEHSCTIGDLATKLFKSNATMTGIIDRLEKEHLVTRTRGGEQDRRKVVVQVTPKGRTALERARVNRREQMRQALADFNPQDIENFVRLLTAYMNELEKES
jgi:DNA-binding MarR family transcriptional regulator